MHSLQPVSDARGQKRVLWEVRQRYNVAAPPRPARPRRPAARPSTAPPPPPTRPTPGSGRRAPGGIPRKTHWLRRAFLLLIFALLISGGVFGYKILAAGNKITVAERSLLGQLRDLLFRSGQQLHGEADDRVNVLLIAVGGEGHSGENLADTIVVASIRPSDNSVGLLSVPRDLYVQVPDEEYFTKINTIHALGESQEKNGGPELLRRKVEEITGLPIHYYARIDFTAFKHIVDAVGGISITIENEFFDYWHKISFPAGAEKMNGERALAYVRARYIEPESLAGDFERATRQQQVLLALREKVFSVQTAFDFTAANSILNSLSENIRTDMELWEMKRFYELARLIQRDKVKSVVLTSGPQGVLTGRTEVLGGTPASVLRPRTGDYSEIQAIAQDIFSESGEGASASELLASGSNPEQPAESATPEPEPPAKPTVEIRNGTNVTGLAARTADRLRAEGYEVIAVGNAKNRSTPNTRVYALVSDHTDGAKGLADFLRAASDSGLPSDEAASEADVLIILGADAEE